MKWISVYYLVMNICYATCYAENVVIGVDQMNPPMSTKTDSASHFMGFEIEIMNAVCSKLKLSCSYHEVIANEILNELDAGHIDLAMDSIAIPKFHMEGLIFSLPYLTSNAQFMTLSTSNMSSFSEIGDKTIGVRLGAFQRNLESDMFLKHIFKTKLQIMGYRTMAELLTALRDHDVDVIFANKVSVDYWHDNNKHLYKYIGNPLQIGNGYGILATSKHEHLMIAINDTIHKMMEDGSYDIIYQHYFAPFQ